jgi:hypothetical protein
MKRRQLLAFSKNIIKAGELLSAAHRAHVALAMLLSDISLGKLNEDPILDSYIEELKKSGAVSASFSYQNTAGDSYRVYIAKKKKHSALDRYAYKTKTKKTKWKDE